jgi:hypothetical protein
MFYSILLFSHFRDVNIGRVLIGYWIYWHNSELQVIIAPPMKCTLKHDCCKARRFFKSRFLVTDVNSGDLSAYLFQVLLSQPSPLSISTDPKSKSHCDWQSVSLGVEPHMGLMTGYLLLFDSYGLVSAGRPFWRVFCIFYWLLPAQCFSGLSPLGLATIFYCPRLETSLFVASYYSQGHRGDIRPRLHTEVHWAGLGSSLYNPLGGSDRKHRPQQFCYFYGRLPSDSPDIVVVFTYRYQATALVPQFVSRSLPSNGSIRHIMLTHESMEPSMENYLT